MRTVAEGIIMKRIGRLLALTLLTASMLSGCLLVPVGGWYWDGGYHHHGGYYHRW